MYHDPREAVKNVITAAEAADRYSEALLALLSRVAVPVGDLVIEKELKPVYELLDLLQEARRQAQ